MSKTPRDWIIATLVCVIVYAPTLLSSARSCEGRGGVLVRGVLGGTLCVVKKKVMKP